MRNFLRPVIQNFTYPFVLGFSISILAVVHLPSTLQIGIFDRNAAPQFISLCAIGILVCTWLVIRKRVVIPILTAYAVGALFLSSFVSLLLSDSFTSSLLGDTGRYSGLASLWAFLSLAFAGTLLTSFNLRDALLGLSIGIVVVTLAGLLQVFNVITLPTGGGVGSTLGNLDFLSAWIGTTLLIVILTFREFSITPYLSALYVFLAIVVLRKIDAKQGFLDLLLVTIFSAFYFLYKKANVSGISAGGWKAIATFIFLLWSEAIYLIPMAKLPFPGVSSDQQVSIRADFWFSAAQMFVHHLGFGVGPDNFGNYYEKFRSLNSVKTTEFVLANDAHSSMLQTFATLGIFATLIFLLLLLMVIYSAIDLYVTTRDNKYLILLLAFFVFYTNALISPITLPNKAIFWLIAGFLIGENARLSTYKNVRVLEVRTWIPSSLIAIVLVLALVNFLPPFAKINSALELNNAGKKFSYKVSDSLPCIVYANAQLSLVQKSGGDVKSSAEAILRNHPRCLDALNFLAQEALSRKDYEAARPYIYQLLDVAPARNTVVRLAAIYAMGAGDEQLKNLLTSQGLKLGILTQSQLK
jgi:hypothetical protein